MNQKKQRTLAIFALAVALVATTVAYAALSTTLNISGNITKKGGSWSVGIANISGVSTKGTGAMSTAPKVTGTTLSFDANLKKPGDSVSFTFDIVNSGTVTAQMSFLGGQNAIMNINGVSTSFASYSEMKVVSDDITYLLEIKASNGNFYSTYDQNYITLGDKNTSTNTKTFKLTLTWNAGTKITTVDDKKLTVTASFPFKQA